MAGGTTSGSRELDQTPTWAVAGVCAVIIIVSFALESGLHKLGQVDIVGGIFTDAVSLGADKIIHKCRRAFEVMGIDQGYVNLSQPYDSQQRDNECAEGSTRRGCESENMDGAPHPYEHDDIPSFTLLSQQSEPYIPQLQPDISPPNPMEVPGDNDWRDALMETPSSFAPRFDRQYVRRRRKGSSSTTHASNEDGDAPNDYDGDAPNDDDGDGDAPEQFGLALGRQRRNVHPPLCFTEQQRRGGV